MLVALLLLIAGLVVLTIGAELMVKGAATVAFRFGISPLVVGLTIVGCGTSAPEMVVSVFAGLQGKSEIAVGNVMGSNIANVGLVLGIAALIHPIHVTTRTVKKEMPIALGAMVLNFLFAIDGEYERWEGVLMLFGFALFLVYCIRTARSEEAEVESTHPTKRPWLLLVFGIAGLVGGANLFVNGAVTIAKMIGFSDRVIGLTIIALGTSLPELATSVVASIRKQDDISVGNVIGSILFNSLLVLGVVSVLSPSPIESKVVWLDIPVMLGVTFVSFPLMWLGYDLKRFEAGAILLTYAFYLTYVAAFELA